MMKIDKFIVDWAATAFILLYEKDEQLRRLRNKGMYLKRKVKRTGNRLVLAKDQLIKKEITNEEYISIERSHINALANFNVFIEIEFAAEDKEIQLQLNSVQKHLNDILSYKQKLHKKLTTQKTINKTKGKL